jgi:hypothetical protein
MSFRPTPATVIAAAALFVALGGSAVALSDAVQPRCKNGAVRGIAAVTGGANVPGEFTGRKDLFARKFNCTGGATQVRRVSTGVYEVRFLRNPAGSALVSATGALSAIDPLPGGIFKVSLFVPGRDDEIDTPFVVVVI